MARSALRSVGGSSLMLLATVLLAVVVEGRSGPAIRSLVSSPSSLHWDESAASMAESRVARGCSGMVFEPVGPWRSGREAVIGVRVVDAALLAIPPPGA